jgi:cytochrome c
MMRRLIPLVLLLIILTACRDVGAVVKVVPGGDPAQGERLIGAYGCGSCHTIPGIYDADTYVGPPLTAYSKRHYIAGNLPNTADNLIRWLQDPQAVEPGTAMPDLNINENDARHIAAYLYKLR